MKSNSVHFAPNEKLDRGCSNTRSPPLDNASGCPHGDDSIRFVLGHECVIIFGYMIGDDISRGRIIILKFFVVVEG